jgi:two-component system response regulator FixJ
MPGENAVIQKLAYGVVLLNEPDPGVRDALTILLRGANWSVAHVNKCEDVAEAMKAGEITAVISEARLPDCTPEEILERCMQADVPVVFTGHDLTLQEAVDLIRRGALDFLDKPFPQSRLLDLLDDLKNSENT